MCNANHMCNANGIYVCEYATLLLTNTSFKCIFMISLAIARLPLQQVWSSFLSRFSL